MLKNTHFCLLILVIFLSIYCGNSMELGNCPSDYTCDAEDEALAQSIAQIIENVKKSETVTQHFVDMQEKLSQLERNGNELSKMLQEMSTKLEKSEENQQQLKKVILEEIQRNSKDKGFSEIGRATALPSVEGAGEIIIQRRMDGSMDFQRNWSEYKTGFGNSSGEFFIGLENLHKLTNTRPHELLIVMEDWDNDRRYARYDQFIVGSEAEKYSLKSLGKYTGSAGDSLTYHLGQKFTTKDQDNDPSGQNCAQLYTGAWWHNSCHHSNLNGQYLKGTITQFAVGTHWLAFKGYKYSLKFVEMILRPN